MICSSNAFYFMALWIFAKLLIFVQHTNTRELTSRLGISQYRLRVRLVSTRSRKTLSLLGEFCNIACVSVASQSNYHRP